MKKRYKIIIWNFSTVVFEKDVVFETNIEAETFAMGVFHGIRHTQEATGYAAKREKESALANN